MWLVFLAAGLNGLNILAADIQNAHIYVTIEEKVYIIRGSGFGFNKKHPSLIVKAWYGLKSSGVRFIDHLTVSLCSIGLKRYLADPDVWMRPGTKLDGFEY